MKIPPNNITTLFLVAPLAVPAVLIGALIAFPGNIVIWQVAAWSLALCALALIVVLPVTAYSLAANASARTWSRATASGL